MSDSKKNLFESEAEEEPMKRLHTDEVAWLTNRHIQAIQNNEAVSTNSHGIPTSKQIDLWKLSSPKEAMPMDEQVRLVDEAARGAKIIVQGKADFAVTPEMLAAQTRRAISAKLQGLMDGNGFSELDVRMLSELTSLHGHLTTIPPTKS